MVNDVRNYSSTTGEMSLLGACDTAAESVSLDSLQGLPTPPFALILSAGGTSEEVVLATEISGSIVTITRAQGGTTAHSHTAGARVIHGLYGGDLQTFMDHVEAATEVHGLASGVALVGASNVQVLTNKSIDGADNTVTGLDGATAIEDGSIPDAKLGSDIDADTVGGAVWTVSATEPVAPTAGDIWVDIS